MNCETNTKTFLTTCECKSGRYLAYYLYRPDIIANGETKQESEDNLKSLYKSVIDFEKSEPVIHTNVDTINDMKKADLEISAKTMWGKKL